MSYDPKKVRPATPEETSACLDYIKGTKYRGWTLLGVEEPDDRGMARYWLNSPDVAQPL